MKQEKHEDIILGIDATPEEVAGAVLNVSYGEMDDEKPCSNDEES